MKKNYQWLFAGVENILLQMHTLKMKGGELLTLHNNRPLYYHIIWTKEKKAEFDNFWKKHYGRTISANGHRYYEALNGIFHKDYFPEFLYTTKLEPKLNNFKYAQVYNDKNLFEILFAKSKNVKFPTTYALNSGGTFYDHNRKVTSRQQVLANLENVGKIVIKPTVGGSEGRGVEFYDILKGLDVYSKKRLSELFDGNQDYIIQEQVTQHPCNEKLHPMSLNSIRIITYIAENNIHHAPLCLRMGTGSSKVDNLLAGGLLIGVSDDGTLNKYAYKLGNSKERLTAHPDTHIEFDGYKIEGTRAIIEVAKELHGFIPNIGIISWDIAFTSNSEVLVIEANFIGQSIRYPQIAHGKPIFGEHTPYMMKLISVSN